MKKNLFHSALVLLVLFSTSLSHAQSTEEDTIKKVLTSETDAFYRGDFAAWKSYWSRDPKVSRMIVTKQWANFTQGAEKGEAMIAAAMKNNPERSAVRPKTDNYSFRIKDNLAYVEFDAFTPTRTGDTSHSHEYRILTKENGEWKIANQIVTVLDDYTKSDPATIEGEINGAGYKLMTAKRLNDAIDLFKMNVKLFPNAWNVYDSLGEAYAVAGNKQEAIKNYEQSIKLNPMNENGKKALEKLRSK
jgi:tetratricopeptide (TPR) repeat protein